MQFPGRSQRPPDPYPVRGEQLKPGENRDGVVDDGNVAWPERVEEARRSWPQARPEDFEKTGKRRYVDRATGVEYLRVPGAPLLSAGAEETRGATVFFVSPDNRIVLLRRADFPVELVGPTGYVTARKVTTGPSTGGIY
jgi:hypothetical protein